MGTEREASFPIEDWEGVNRNLDSEDLSPKQLWSAENLWEKTLGQLETRPGSETVMYRPTGGVSNSMGNIYKIYKSWGETKRFCALKCTPTTTVLNALPTGITMSFVTDANGYWNSDHVFGATYDTGLTVSMQHRRIVLRFVGYGRDQFYEATVSGITGYSAGTKAKLRIEVANTFDNSEYTGIEVYVTVASGEVQTPATIDSSSQYQEQTMWVGHIDVTTDLTQTIDYLYSPAGYDDTIVDGTSIGTTERSFGVQAFVSGVNNVSGTFVGGKTYYVLVMPQYSVFSDGGNSRMCYRQPGVDVYGGEVVPITIPGTTTGYITVNAINPNTIAFLVAVGDTPQTLQPLKIFNDSEIGGGASTAPSVIVPGTFWLETPPSGCPGVVDFRYTAAGIATFAFRFSDFSVKEMFLGINDDDTKFPIFCARLNSSVNDPTGYEDVISDFTAAPGSAATYPWVWYLNNAIDQMQKMGDGSRYIFTKWDNHAFFVNDYDPLSASQITISSITYGVMEHRTFGNYFICDGNVAAPVIEDYQSTQITLPNMRYISKFDSSIVMGGGAQNVDPRTGLANDSSRTVYFSRAENPYDFTIAGAASPTHQTVVQADDGESISGFGIYTNTTSDQGPLSQLVTTKKSATWIMNSLPTTDAGALTSFSSRILSSKVGGFHLTIVNTPIGTLMAGADNVYVLREDGEPTPIGQNIAPLLKDANMANAVACYHDKHYKLSFSHPDYSNYNDGAHNNVEMWLNINKVIEQKGKEDWVGPMIGRGIDYCFVEDQDADGIAYNQARTRYAIDNYAGVGRILKADVYVANTIETIYDRTVADDTVDEPVVATMETKDLDITPGDNNWNKLIKRFYLKLRTNWVGVLTAQARYYLYVDGETEGVEYFGLTVGNNGSADFYARPLRLIGLFPTGRLRGRTVKFKFSFYKRVSIGGIQVNYQVERRRI